MDSLSMDILLRIALMRGFREGIDILPLPFGAKCSEIKDVLLAAARESFCKIDWKLFFNFQMTGGILLNNGDHCVS
jgi:hypothetical protein